MGGPTLSMFLTIFDDYKESTENVGIDRFNHSESFGIGLASGNLLGVELQKNASALIHHVLREAFVASKLTNYTDAINSLEKPPAWQTWGVGFLIVSACSFSAPLGILLLPCLSKSLYERIMTLLVAIGIGALSGSTIFIMLPQAFHLTELDDFDYHSKSLLIISALYSFFAVDRILQYILEFRRRSQAKRKVHRSTIASIMNTPNAKRKNKRNETEETTLNKICPITIQIESPDEKTEQKEMEQLANDLELAVTNNVLARTFSTRRRIAVLDGLDDIQLANNPKALAHNSRFLDQFNAEQQRKRSLGSPNGVSTNEEVASVAYMIIFGSSANNFVDGMSMGAAFSDNVFRGLSIGIAVISQQFPQELGVLAILVNSGLGVKRTLLFNMVPIVLSYLGFSVGVVLDSFDDTYDQKIFAISSGMYMYIFLGTLIPEIRESTNELIKENLAESFLVTFLHIFGITFGVTFMYFMSTVNNVDF